MPIQISDVEKEVGTSHSGIHRVEASIAEAKIIEG